MSRETWFSLGNWKTFQDVREHDPLERGSTEPQWHVTIFYRSMLYVWLIGRYTCGSDYHGYLYIVE